MRVFYVTLDGKQGQVKFLTLAPSFAAALAQAAKCNCPPRSVMLEDLSKVKFAVDAVYTDNPVALKANNRVAVTLGLLIFAGFLAHAWTDTTLWAKAIHLLLALYGLMLAAFNLAARCRQRVTTAPTCLPGDLARLALAAGSRLVTLDRCGGDFVATEGARQLGRLRDAGARWVWQPAAGQPSQPADFLGALAAMCQHLNLD
jgi:hypothetical protein